MRRPCRTSRRRPDTIAAAEVGALRRLLEDRWLDSLALAVVVLIGLVRVGSCRRARALLMLVAVMRVLR